MRFRRVSKGHLRIEIIRQKRNRQSIGARTYVFAVAPQPTLVSAEIERGEDEIVVRAIDGRDQVPGNIVGRHAVDLGDVFLETAKPDVVTEMDRIV